MAQYQSHTGETLTYMEKYLETFHWTKDMFLEFQTSKATHGQANYQYQELKNQILD